MRSSEQGFKLMKRLQYTKTMLCEVSILEQQNDLSKDLCRTTFIAFDKLLASGLTDCVTCAGAGTAKPSSQKKVTA